MKIYPGIYIVLLLVIIMITTACSSKNEIRFKKSGNNLVVSGGEVEIHFQKDKNDIINHIFYVKDKEKNYKEVLRSFTPGENEKLSKSDDQTYARLYNTRISPKRYLLAEMPSEISYDKTTGIITLKSTSENFECIQYIQLYPEEKRIHYSVHCTLPDSKLDYLMSTFVFNTNSPPFFVHTPALKFDNEESNQNRFRIVPSEDQIIGDRSFYAPAIILQQDHLFTALVPDLNVINTYRVISPDARRVSFIPRNIFGVPIEEDKFTMPVAMDLNVASGLTEKPIIAYGYADAVLGHHMRFNRFNDSTMIRTIEGRKLIYEFDLILDAAAENYGKYAEISQFIWKNYGHDEFTRHPHLPMPFDEYIRIIDSITFRPSPYPDIDIPVQGYENTGSWLQWEEKGIPMGGYRSAINWWNDKLHNSSFWNNARDALGFWYWGTENKDSVAIDRAHRIINWCLSAPRNESGLFATLYNAEDKSWGLQFSDPMHGESRYFLTKSRSYNIATNSKTGAHLLDYYLRCEKDPRIIEYLKPYGNWLISVIDERGSVPAYVSDEMVESDILKYSAHPAASMWFLASLYLATSESVYLEGAKRIAGYLEKEIIPEAKWVDHEQYFSCGAKPLTFTRDRVQNQVARGNLSVIWASEGFASLFEATGSDRFLRDGQLCIDYLSFTQCSWNPHYIYTAYPFGGFGVDNSDVTSFLDARQAETVKPFIWYGKQLGRQDLLERGVAAARSSIVLINHPKHQTNNTYRHINIYPFGLGPENIDHEGYPQSAMRTHPSWGEGSGIYTGLAEAHRNLGGLYINTKSMIYAGVDGIKINEIKFEGDSVIIDAESWLSDKHLPDPWEKPYHTNLYIDGDPRSIYLNDKKIEIRGNKADLEILPGKYIREFRY